MESELLKDHKVGKSSKATKNKLKLKAKLSNKKVRLGVVLVALASIIILVSGDNSKTNSCLDYSKVGLSGNLKNEVTLGRLNLKDESDCVTILTKDSNAYIILPMKLNSFDEVYPKIRDLVNSSYDLGVDSGNYILDNSNGKVGERRYSLTTAITNDGYTVQYAVIETSKEYDTKLNDGDKFKTKYFVLITKMKTNEFKQPNYMEFIER
jgi:hypothetical protein